MPNYLSTKEWKTELARDENKKVKKTGISEALDDYDTALGKDDIGKMLAALEVVIGKAGDAKDKYSKEKHEKDKDGYAGLVEYLGKVFSEVRKVRKEKAALLENLDKQENEDSTLGKALVKARQLQPDCAWYFVLVPGKPSSGLVVTMKEPKKADIEKAFELRGKRGPFTMGRIYGEGRYPVLETESVPVKGWAESAVSAALMHAETRISVLMRGGGVELADENDIDPVESGTGGIETVPTSEGERNLHFEKQYELLRQVVSRFGESESRFGPNAGDRIPMLQT